MPLFHDKYTSRRNSYLIFSNTFAIKDRKIAKAFSIYHMFRFLDISIFLF